MGVESNHMPTNGLEVTMASAIETKAASKETAAPLNERSTVDFPYTDLDAAVDVVKGVHSAGGNACDSDQLAAQLNLEAKGGGFRLRLNGAKTFGLITYERGGRITLTELGQQVIDPLQERQARMNAFLAVELYSKVFDQFKGGPLPPQAGFERSLVTLGVGDGVKTRARQVLLRSAKQAGFFEHAQDRLVRPSIKNEVVRPKETGPKDDGGNNQKAGGGGTGGDGTNLHPLINGLVVTLPNTGETWPTASRLSWLTMANNIFNLLYKAEEGSREIEIKEKQQL